MAKNKKNVSFSNTFNEIGKNAKTAKKSTLNSLKEIPNLPWNKLPTQGWILLIASFILMILIFYVSCILL